MKSVTANLATYPKRKTIFLKCLKNLLYSTEIDKIRVYLNEYKSIPEEFPRSEKVEYHLGEHNLKDSGKFYWAESENEYHFTLDDDLLYPDEFFKKHVELLEKTNGRAIVTLHGKIFKNNPKTMLDIQTPMFHCLRDCPSDQAVNFGGTGVMVFDTEHVKIPLDLFQYHGMADIFVAKFCQDNKIPMICRAHKANELTLLNPGDVDTLWENRSKLFNAQQRVLSTMKDIKIYATEKEGNINHHPI